VPFQAYLLLQFYAPRHLTNEHARGFRWSKNLSLKTRLTLPAAQ
jgi:hypothetical protein